MCLVSEDQLMKNIKEMKTSLTSLEKDIELFSKTNDPNDKFSEVLSISFMFRPLFCKTYVLLPEERLVALFNQVLLSKRQI